uniref:Uncharacterized protein LOC100184315 n=1 Tax=Phallusia mammillata TaxID=59560 RepID=A0A6F9DIQ1_9ASCI|nr:uncharacterized protein LOC100184315 [Phallusia mammillata]
MNIARIEAQTSLKKQKFAIFGSQLVWIVTYLILVTMTQVGFSTTVKGQISPFVGARGAEKPEGMISNDNCFNLVKKCHKDKQCREAFRQLNTKCAVKAGSCNAAMMDLPICAEIMDTLTARIFNLKQKCTCQRSSVRCETIHSRVYDNPCFANINFLRQRNLIPKFEDAPKKAKTTTPLTETARTVDLLETLLTTYEDYPSEETEHVTTTSPKSTTTFIAKSEEKRMFAVNDITSSRLLEEIEMTDTMDRKHPTYSSSHDDGVLLHVVAIATGVLVFLTLAVGTSLVVYFGLRRRPTDEKHQITMT